MPKISELDIITRLTEDDFFVVVDKETGTTRQITLSDILDIVQHVFNLEIRRDPPEPVVEDPLGVVRTPGTLISSPDLSPQISNTETAVAGKISKSGSLSASRGTVSKLQTELLALGFKLVSTSTANAGGKVNYAAPQNNTHHA